MKNILLTLIAAASSLLPSLALAGAPRTPTCGAQSSHFENDTDRAMGTGSPPQVVTSAILVSGQPNFIWDVDLTTFITHTFAADLDITLTSPSGTVVTLTTDNGGGNDNVFNGTRWDDSANPSGIIPYSNTGNIGLVTDTAFLNLTLAPALVPEEPLAAFYGENPNGIWTLSVSDDASADGGLLDKWTLDLVALPNSPVSVTFPPAVSTIALPIPDNQTGVAVNSLNISNFFGRVCDLNVTVQIQHTFSGHVQATVTSPSGTVVTLTSNNGDSNDNVFLGTTFSNHADPGNQVPFSSGAFAASAMVTDTLYLNGVNKIALTPEESFGAFFGENPNGTWKLSVADSTLNEFGFLNGWSLGITTCIPLLDADEDSFGDECDGCPTDPAKSAPGVCGCGVPEVVSDSDGDGTVDCLDQCSSDSFKTSPGSCGCGVADADTNLNGVLDCFFNQELRARGATLRSLIGGLKPAKNSKGKKKLTSLKKQVNTALTDLANYSSSNGGVLTVKSGSNLSKLVSSAKGAVKKAIKLLNSSSRKNATKAISALENSLL